MRVQEWWWLAEAKKPRKTYGKFGMTEDEADELYGDLQDAIAEDEARKKRETS